MDASKKPERPQHPRANANIFEILSFSWMIKLFKIGHKRDLEENDLYTILNDHKSSLLGNELEKKWKLELDKACQANRKPSLLKVLIHMFGNKFMFYGFVLSIGEIILKTTQPLFIYGLLAYFNPEGTNKTDKLYAYMCASGLIFSKFLSLIMYHSTQIEFLHCGMKIRIACCSTIYRKALCLSQTALGETTVGQVINLLSNDVNQFDTTMTYLHFLWIGPLQTLIATYFMWREVGISSIFGVAMLFLFVPLHGYLGKKTSEFRLKTAATTDERVRLMNEIISGLQVIKMYTWEKPFEYLVQNVRKKEMEQIQGSLYIKCILLSFKLFHSRIALFINIISYVTLGNFITAQKVFAITSYYNILHTTMTIIFPMSCGQLADMLISIKRLQHFLLYEEKNDQVANRLKYMKLNIPDEKVDNERNIINGNDVQKYVEKEHPKSNLGIVISNATAKWTNDQTNNSLENINLTISPARLVVVIGSVGAGKSSLFQVILRELPLSKGTVSVHGVVSYASQEPWLFAGSVQQNILFGLPMDKERYQKVIDVCALRTDFEQFTDGDKTIVGERGVSLSGGQRARINLARAVYKKADIYLLDDPLSAVDTHVSKHLFEKCIKGYLKEKTCILITHQLQFLTKIDQIVLMKNGSISVEGTYQELQTSGLDFTKLLKATEYTAVENESNCAIATSDSLDSFPITSYKYSTPCVSSSNLTCKSIEDHNKLIEMNNTDSHGETTWNLYWSYISAGGNIYKIIFLLFMFIFTQVLASGGDFWIMFWVNLEEHIFRDTYYYVEENSTITSIIKPVLDEMSYPLFWWSISRQKCIIVFAVITISIVLSTLIRSNLCVKICIRASLNLHQMMFSAITRAKMLFFNTNSSGKILNRFSKDIGEIDEVLPGTLFDCIQTGLTLAGIVTVVLIVNVYLITPTLIILFVLYKLSVFYLSTSRSIKRLEGNSHSPVVAHLNASLQGLTTIRAFEMEEILSKEFDNYQDTHSSVWFLFISSSKALGTWLDLVSLVYISVITFSFLVINSHTHGGNVGLAITQAFGLSGMFQWCIRKSAELENQMTSVECVLEYTNIPGESDFESSSDIKPPKEWPHKGQITFSNFFLRYSANTRNVLKNLNINIKPMEKVGIIGRTGAGKSSLIEALFRLSFNEGSLVIDDIEINKLPLNELRSKISIIPQEPVLFSGTMRKNLDPFDEYSDHVLWNALDNVELKGIVEDLPGGLNSKMFEGGSNFSVGQRQLICLARAIVRNNKILVLDEATANVDPRTDALIQNTLRQKFRTSTVLTIAHRLNTVMDSDKVLVMDAGEMVEFDHPFVLLNNSDGYLYKMVEQTERTAADLLRNIAAESYKAIQMTKE